MYYIAKEDIGYSTVIFPKGTILEKEDDFPRYCIVSNLIRAKLLSEAEEEDLVFEDIPDTWFMEEHYSACKYEELPWYDKIEEIPEDNPKVIEYLNQTEKYLQTYNQRLEDYLESQTL